MFNKVWRKIFDLGLIVWHKKVIFLFLFTYAISYFLESLFFVNWKNLLAEEKLNNANFVAIFVEEDLYDGIK